jgi:hypothetical protein
MATRDEAADRSIIHRSINQHVEWASGIQRGKGHTLNPIDTWLVSFIHLVHKRRQAQVHWRQAAKEGP